MYYIIIPLRHRKYYIDIEHTEINEIRIIHCIQHSS